MSEKFDISVVMSVHNGEGHLHGSINSILSQEGINLELIIINDGSTDRSRTILNEYTIHDNRVRVIHQENQGLTKALIKGCSEASGEYIARNDAGDSSIPGRFIKQLSCLEANSDAVLVSCGTRFIGPEGELLRDEIPEGEEATWRLQTLDLRELRGPSHHGSTMFRRSAYEKVGGYRTAFYFAQDLDLWTRMVEIGKHIIIPEVFYEAQVSIKSLSGNYRKEQIKTAEVILECMALRRRNLSELPALQKALSIRPCSRSHASRIQYAKALYFIGMSLKIQNNAKATSYFRKAIQMFPFHLKAWLRLLSQ